MEKKESIIVDKTPPINDMFFYLTEMSKKYGMETTEIENLKSFYEMTGRLPNAKRDSLIMFYVSVQNLVKKMQDKKNDR